MRVKAPTVMVFPLKVSPETDVSPQSESRDRCFRKGGIIRIGLQLQEKGFDYQFTPVSGLSLRGNTCLWTHIEGEHLSLDSL
jgi:hypothetical protein